MDIQTEQWRPVVGWEHLYEVSDLGRIRNSATSELLRGCKTPKGYIRITLPAPELRRKQRSRMLHQLILEAFVGPAPEGAVCCHGINGVHDNSISNLRWDTQHSNVQDRIRDGKNNHPRPRARGAGNHRAKLTERQAQEILAARGSCSQSQLASRYGVSAATISAIHRGRKWSHLHSTKPVLSQQAGVR